MTRMIPGRHGFRLAPEGICVRVGDFLPLLQYDGCPIEISPTYTQNVSVRKELVPVLEIVSNRKFQLHWRQNKKETTGVARLL